MAFSEVAPILLHLEDSELELPHSPSGMDTNSSITLQSMNNSSGGDGENENDGSGGSLDQGLSLQDILKAGKELELHFLTN